MLRLPEARDMQCLAAIRSDELLQHMLLANPCRHPREDPLAEAQDWVERKKAAGVFRIIAGPDDVALGFVQVSDIHRKNRFGWFGIALLPEARGHGIGRHVLAEIEALTVREVGLRKLLLQVRSDNDAAISLYETSGWQKVGVLNSHYDDGAVLYDVFIFEKILAHL